MLVKGKSPKTPKYLFYERLILRKAYLMKDRNIKDNGKNKNIIIKFRVSPQEFEIIENRMSLTREISISSYTRKMAMNGLIINLDLKEIAQLNKSLINIGANINQIAKRVNATNRYYDDDIKYIKEVSENIWQSLKSVQSKLLSL